MHRIDSIKHEMNTRRQAQEALILFNDRVARLDRSSLAARMANPRYTLDYERLAKSEWVSLDGVTEDAIDAFVLHIRLLTQDQDGFSIRCLAKDVYSHGSVPPALKSRFDQLRSEWREYTDHASLLRHPNENRNFTYGELFEALLYGGLAHANADKVELFKWLTGSGAFSSIVCVSFLSSLRIFLKVVRQFRDVNKELLEQWAC
jgi:hypothetical protein